MTQPTVSNRWRK